MRLTFEADANEKFLYGTKGFPLPGMFGRLVGVTDPTGDAPLAFLITLAPYAPKRLFSFFVPIGVFSVKEEESVENFFVGVDLLNKPNTPVILEYHSKIKDFIQKNFTVGAEGDGVAASKWLESFII